MKAIILAAGQGKRLRPLTDDKPKCLVELAGRSLLDWQLAALQHCGIKDIVIIGGWCAGQLAAKATRFYTNPAFDTSNMVHTLFCAAGELDGTQDALICYSDIVYEPSVIAAIMKKPADIATVVDKNWRDLWQLRMDDPLSDAETLKLDDAGCITELGKKPGSYAEIEGQYIGIVRVAAAMQNTFKEAYTALPEIDATGRARKDMYMTDFLQHIIDHHAPIKAVCIEGGWLEVDTLDDIARYEAALATGALDNMVRLYA